MTYRSVSMGRGCLFATRNSRIADRLARPVLLHLGLGRGDRITRAARLVQCLVVEQQRRQGATRSSPASVTPSSSSRLRARSPNGTSTAMTGSGSEARTRNQAATPRQASTASPSRS